MTIWPDEDEPHTPRELHQAGDCWAGCPMCAAEDEEDR